MARVVSERADAVYALADVFRKYGVEGASLSRIREVTGLGRGSLYHFFPNGKADMAKAVLETIENWFANEVFAPLLTATRPGRALDDMFDTITDYFDSGRNICLMGCLSLTEDGTPFSDSISGYFRRWIKALQQMLERGGVKKMDAMALAEDTVAGIQGAIILSRAQNDAGVFSRQLRRLRNRLSDALPADH